MQDREYEISDFTRIDEFISEYKKPLTTRHERNSLMEIILDSINSALEEQIELDIDSYIFHVRELLIINKESHLGTIDYWTGNDFSILKKLNLNS